MTNFEYMCIDPKLMAKKIIEIRNGISGAGREVMDVMYSNERYNYYDAVVIWLEKEVEECDS